MMRSISKIHIFLACIICAIILLIILLPSLYNFSFNLNNADIIYHIEVDGLTNISISSFPVTLLLPLPLMNDQPTFPDSFYIRELDGWNSSVIITEYGPVLSLTGTTSPLKNIHARYDRYSMFADEVPVSTLSGLKFSPETTETATPYSLHKRSLGSPLPSDTQVEKFPPGVVVATRDPSWPVYETGTKYVDREDIGPTLVYIPDTLRSETGNISIFIKYQTNSKYGNLFENPNNMRGYYITAIIEQIPGNVSGWIPVRPQAYPTVRPNNFSVS